MKIFYMGLEKVESRYSHQLTDWNTSEFERLGVPYRVVTGSEIPAVQGQIVNGSVLDAHGRTYYAMTQMSSLVAMMQAGEVTENDVVFFEDMFTPGIESLAYIMAQTPDKYRPRVYVRCLAQTIDPDDFVHRTGMFDWMRHFELMLDSFITGILVASEEMVAHLRIAGFKSNIYVTGLPFGKQEVRSRVPHLKALSDRPKVVSFASRWDDEKQPFFFLQVMDAVKQLDPSIQFQILTGNKTLKSNNEKALHAARSYDNSWLTIKEGLTKNEYYQELANSRLLMNTALQDWVSNTISEADTLGCMTLFPAYRSFPETVGNRPEHLYLPWSVEDAAAKLVKLINLEMTQPDIGKISDYQDRSIVRTVKVLKGGQSWARNTLGYRQHVARTKF